MAYSAVAPRFRLRDAPRLEHGTHYRRWMPLRVYKDRDGQDWRVWTVTPGGAGAPMLEASYRDGWLCFERLDGTDRRRLSLSDVPAAWETLPEERIDLLRRVAEPAGRRSGAPGTSTGSLNRQVAPLNDDESSR